MVLAWLTFGFAGVYTSTLLVPAVICGLLALAYRPWRLPRAGVPRLHRLMIAVLVAIFIQMLPLPGPLLDVISPHAREAWSRLLLAVPWALPLTLDLPATAKALFVAAGFVLTFMIARRVFATGGVRIVARGVSTIGLVLAAIALLQDATGNGYIYWRWKIEVQGPPPFGPFINRNHFATWAVLAIPLCAGYLIAHSEAHATRGVRIVLWRRRLATFFDGRALGLTASICLLTAALIITMSRSGFAGLAAALVTGLILRLRRGEGAASARAARWSAAAAVAAVGLTLTLTSVAALTARLLSVSVSVQDRLLIWRDTLPIIGRFWLTGTGAGTFETSMLLYQRASPGVLFNQAHDHYLQVLSEGGLLLAIPVGWALALGFRAAFGAVDRDRSGMYWLRAGAFCSIVGAAVQSLWETGLTIPANAALAALVAAIVIHDPVVHAPRF